MSELYPNTTILDIPRAGSAATPPEITYHSIFGVPFDVILPVCVILFVVWYFQGRPELKIYAVALAITYAILPSWVVIVLAIMIIFMKKSKWLSGYITEEHQHDVGKFLKGFTVFWAYIAFSQFMLIWYANIPEETEFYIIRSLGGWMPVSFALLIFRFVVPFLVLLPRGSKRNDTVLLGISILVLVMQYIDLYWLVYPNFFGGSPKFGFSEIGVFLGFAGLFLMTVVKFMSKNSLVAVKDPRIHEALKHHVTY